MRGIQEMEKDMNNEGYRDPTADEAVYNISADDNKVNLVILICKAAAKLAGFKIAERIVLVDVKKKRTWR